MSRYVGVYLFTSPILLLRDPDLIKQICIKDFDTFSEHRPMVPEGTEPIWTDNLVASKSKYEIFLSFKGAVSI